jgi:polyphosphate kinase
MNSLIDDEIIHAAYAASQAGVRIRLNVRGICALRPGIPDVSDGIEVVSIVDRFLEHSRIYYFLNGGDEEVYLASGDWMTRNLDKRVELMFPVDDPTHKARVLQVLRSMFLDTEKARWLRPDGAYERRRPARGEEAFRVQHHLQDEARRRASLAHGRAGIVLQPEER